MLGPTLGSNPQSLLELHVTPSVLLHSEIPLSCAKMRASSVTRSGNLTAPSNGSYRSTVCGLKYVCVCIVIYVYMYTI